MGQNKDSGSLLGRLTKGIGMVVVTLVCWWLFMLVTWLSGRGFAWVAPVECRATPGAGFATQLWEVLLGHIECSALHPVVTGLLLVMAIWVAGRAFFPPSYPPEA